MRINLFRAHGSLIMICTLIILALLLLPEMPYAANQMADYCYLPPFVMDPFTPPNIMIVYEKGADIMKRAYPLNYAPTDSYYGLFDPTSKYRYDTIADYFVREDCALSPGSNCFSGNLLNWALSSSLDVSRRALVGFGWPETGAGNSAGDVFTYTGGLISYGQWEGINPQVAGGGYTFYLLKTRGSLPSGLRIRVGEYPNWNGKCTADIICIVSKGRVALKLPNPSDINDTSVINQRIGIIQKYGDKDRDYIYDSDAPRFGIRRWNTGADKQADILIDPFSSLTGTQKNLIFKNLLTATSKAPGEDPSAPYLGDMMEDIVDYFKGLSTTYKDNEAYTQTPYNWTQDPARRCRRSFALFVTTGANIEPPSLSPPGSCSSGVDDTLFSQWSCYGFSQDLHTAEGKQSVKTYVVHTSFYGEGGGNESKLKYASATVGGGEYIKADDASKLHARLEEAIVNILSSSASASTVATLTTQTRESSTLAQAYFYPRMSEISPLKWIGYLRLLWSDASANIREDTATDATLDLKNDKIIDFFYDDQIDPQNPQYRARTYNDSDGDMKVDACPGTSKPNADVITIWEAQNLLTNTLPDLRNIKVGNDSNNNEIVEGTEFLDFTTALKSTFQPIWSIESYCLSNPARWCANDSDCSYCNANISRGCSTGADCNNYCIKDSSISCSGNSACNLGSCSSMYCDNNPTQPCTSSSDCPPGGTCVGTCSWDPTKTCTAEGGCDFGPCELSDTCNTTDTCIAECDSNCSESIIKYVRGYDKPFPSGGGFRLRHEPEQAGPNITDTKKLADIVYSTPRISPNTAVNGYDVRYGDKTYSKFIENVVTNTTPIVIVGANDGMVHAFKVGRIEDIEPPIENGGSVKKVARFNDTALGKELWAYIPYNAVPYLRWYCDSAYCHIPTVDARFTVVDASIGGGAGVSKTADGSSWRRLIIGTMGVGGKEISIGSKRFSSSIFVIDMTNPEVPSLLWERPLPDRTLTTGYPAILRFGNKDNNGDWYIVIGSGPEGITTNKLNYKSGNANLFVFDLRDGSLDATIDLGVSNVAIGDMLATDMDGDYNVDALYFGTYSGTGPTQTGKLYRLRMRSGGSYLSPLNWVKETVIDIERPIFAAPEIAQDAKGNIWLYFGTGLYFTLEHAKATTDIEYLYGVIEEKKDVRACWKESCLPFTGITDVTNAVFSGAKAVKVACVCEGFLVSTTECSPPGTCPSCGASEDSIVIEVKDAGLSGAPSCNTLKDDDAIVCLTDYIAGGDGWRRQRTGEKIFSRPFISGGIVNVTSFRPVDSPCALGGEALLMTVHYTTGTSYIQPAIYYRGGTTGGYSSVTIETAVKVGAGVPPLGESITALPVGDLYKAVTQVSGGVVGPLVQQSDPVRDRYLLWLTR